MTDGPDSTPTAVRRRGHGHAHGGGHGHSHGLVDRSMTRSRDGLRTVAVSLAVLLVTALLQAAIYVGTGSVALLADLIHNAGDALTAIPLGVAFLLRSSRAERAPATSSSPRSSSAPASPPTRPSIG